MLLKRRYKPSLGWANPSSDCYWYKLLAKMLKWCSGINVVLLVLLSLPSQDCAQSKDRPSTLQIFTQADLIESVSLLARKMCAWGIQRSSEKIHAASTIPRDFLPANTSGKASSMHSLKVKPRPKRTPWKSNDRGPGMHLNFPLKLNGSNTEGS